MWIFGKKHVEIIIFLILETLLIVWLNYILVKQKNLWEEERIQKLDFVNQITEDMKCFPVAMAYQKEIKFEDSFGMMRNEGAHEGCDIMDDNNEAGRIPIVSATDGEVTNLGWLYLGGYRIGITSKNNIYYYYAHLDSYAKGLEVGKVVKAGEFLGFMGNSGEGEEGTRGKFPVHLHFGIYIFTENKNEDSVNPYPFLLKINEE